jgi:hypothetical protein
MQQLKKDDSIEFNPFELSKKKHEEDEMFGGFGDPRDSLNKSEDNPFKIRHPKVDDFENNPFGS